MARASICWAQHCLTDVVVANNTATTSSARASQVLGPLTMSGGAVHHNTVTGDGGSIAIGGGINSNGALNLTTSKFTKTRWTRTA